MTEIKDKKDIIREGDKKYLSNKIVYLKKIEGKDLTLIKKDKTSIHSFMYEGAILEKCLPMDDRMNYFNPFESEEEKEYFELKTGRDLSLDWRNPKSAWNTSDDGIKLRFQVDSVIKTMGYKFDLSKPYDVLMYKIAKLQRDVAPSFKTRHDKPHYIWYLSDDEEEKISKKDSFDTTIAVGMVLGAIQDSKDKMKQFLELYYIMNKESKGVPEGISEDALKSEIYSLIEVAPKKVLAVAKDPDKELKQLVIRGIKAGAIQKHGTDSFSFPEGNKYGFSEFVDTVKYFSSIKDVDDTYPKLLQRIQIFEEGLSKL